MKKTLSIIALTILTATSVLSQENIQFGIKGGVNFTNMTADYLVDNEYKTGFHIGGLVEIPFGSKFSLQPEVLYSTQGAKGAEVLLAVPYPGAPEFAPFNVEYKLDYIQIPILAKIYLVESFSLEIGPSFNFLVNDEIIHRYSTDNDIGETFEFSGIIGVSYKIKSEFFAYFRYNHGFTDAISLDYTEGKNYGFSLGIGYMF